MSGPEMNASVEQLLFVVESAQRAGLSEVEIAELVEDAVVTDAALERAA